MKLWQKEFDLDKEVEQFTIGNDLIYDLRIASYDVIASRAHAEMLNKIGLLSDDELTAILEELESILKRIENDEYKIEQGVEDIHSQIELDLTKKLGEIGKKIHAGRSRNDQVLVALHLYYKDTLANIHNKTLKCIDALLDQAELHHNKLMPGYTHSQIGMVSSFGMWFSSYAESLVQDANYLSSVQHLIDQNPLGTGAGYGSSFPLDRHFTTERLGFANLAINPIYAQMTRGKTELLICQSFGSLAYSIGKFASDICLYVSANYQFISLPDQLTTGSSIMPHKKNPDVFELIRAKCNQISTASNQIMMIINNLMSGYHRDFQSMKDVMFPTIDLMESVLNLLEHCIPKIAVQENLLDDTKYDYLYSVEEVNKLVLQGQSFREAYHQVSVQIQNGSFSPDKEINHSHIGSTGNLGIKEIREKLK